jgi:MFS family permease
MIEVEHKTGRLGGPLHMLYAANAISFVGNNLTNLAIPWFVLVTTGSAAKTGITAFFSIVPIVIAGFFGGAIVDRLGYKRTSIISDLASGITVAAIALLHAIDLLNFPLLLALVFLGALLDAPGSTARSALIPDLARQAAVPIERASASIQVVERGSRLIGAPLGGLLIAVFGAAGVLWIDALTFAVSAAMISVAIPGGERPADEEPSGGYLAELRAGLLFIRRDRLIFAVVLTVMVTNLLDAAAFSVGFPLLAKEEYDSAVALGLMIAASGGGAVLGALIYGARGHTVSRRTVFIPAFVATSATPLVMATLPPWEVAVATLVVTGIAGGPLNPILSAIQFERVPEGMRGRVFGATKAGAYIAMPAGVLAGGFLFEGIGLSATFLVIGAGMLITTLSMLINPALRTMDRRPAPVAVPE